MDVSIESFGDILDTEDVCELLGLSKCHVRRMLRAGELPGVKIGARWYVPKSEFERLLETRLENVRSE